MKKIKKQGFTLIELLVVVAIIAILALVVLLALNPVEMARKSRDSRRLSDLSTLRKAIDLTLADGKQTLQVVSNTTETASLDATDATNNLVGMDISKYISTIPQDPRFSATDVTKVTLGTNCDDPQAADFTDIAVGDMYYTFESDGVNYELNAYMESGSNCPAVSEDGGNAAGVYEMGTSLILL